ncbi:MAG: hypothetical protein Q9225_007098 [Loekoesia sp. 1 TL-2023]
MINVGYTTTPKTLSDYNVQKESAIQLMPKSPPEAVTDLVKKPSSANAIVSYEQWGAGAIAYGWDDSDDSHEDHIVSHEQWKAEAIANDFDEDLHIEDPHSHFQMPSRANATVSHEQWRAKAMADDFDEDLHIVDPHSHFELLSQLAQDVIQRSEYFRTERHYSISDVIDPAKYDSASLHAIGLRHPPVKKISATSIVQKV